MAKKRREDLVLWLSSGPIVNAESRHSGQSGISLVHWVVMLQEPQV